MGLVSRDDDDKGSNHTVSKKHDARRTTTMATTATTSTAPHNHLVWNGPSRGGGGQPLPVSWNEALAWMSTLPHPPAAAVAAMVAGTVTFGSTLAVSTWMQQRLLRISTGTMAPIPSVVGWASVCVASWAAHEMAIGTYTSYTHHQQAYRAATAASTSWYHYPQQQQHLSWLPGWSREPLAVSVAMGRNAWYLLCAETQRTWHEFGHPSSSSSRQTRSPHCWNKNEEDWILPPGFLSSWLPPVSWHVVRICVVGCLAFFVLGGRAWAIAPSSYTHVGSYARVSLPATANYATSAKRIQLERLGRRYGCHTCGTKRRGTRVLSRMFGKSPFSSSTSSSLLPSFLSSSKKAPTPTTPVVHFVGDHMPPKSVAEQANRRWWRHAWLWGPVKYRFYPQCVDCSRQQGAILTEATQQLKKTQSTTWWWLGGRRLPSLASAGGGRKAYFHGHQPRWNHATGSVLGAMVSWVAAQEDDDSWVVESSSLGLSAGRSYDQLHQQCRDWYRHTHNQLHDWFVHHPVVQALRRR